MILCETLLSDVKNVLFKISNYTLISRPCKHKKGGGVAILVNDKIKYQIREDIILKDNKNLESVFIEMTCKNKNKHNNRFPI